MTPHTKTRLITHGNLDETGFPTGFQRVQTPKTEFPKGFQRVSKGFLKSFQRVSND